ncbi:MAG: thiamine pyrophosphate-dependent enzyme, partial [Rhodospirillaceae bacterium]|nr:thiamine pyrophosphate-dependent enzyme [Rhodospirillaceae bacterium]
AMAHGYAKAALKPMAFMAHGTVGLQHAAMALYNAWCDRAPVIGILGNVVDGVKRRPGVEWLHTAQDPVAIVRDFVKWDDQPGSLQHFAESMVRGVKIAMTPPMAPVLIVADGDLQEEAIHDEAALSIPRLSPAAPPQGEAGAVRDAARLLVAAENPVIVADRAARTPAGVALLIELAEALGAAVVDQGGRMNFPTTHPLSASDRAGAAIRGADVILGLELTDFWGTVNEYIDNIERSYGPRIKPDTRLIGIHSVDLYMKSNYQDFQRYQPVDIAMAADAEATLPALIDAVRAAMTAARRSAAKARAEKIAADRAEARATLRDNARYGWDARPISTARLAAELWAVIKDTDWALVGTDGGISAWPRRLWNFDKHYQFLGGSGGAGVGYGLAAAVGAALANRDLGRLSVNIQSDGDLMYAPGALWTAVHHKIPLLTVMHNNRAYHQEVMHIQRMALRLQRGIDRAHIGTIIDNPPIDYAKLAQSMGMWAEGPVTDPAELGAALRRALDVVKTGAPALVDVVTQPR